ncbi:hypothetical protein BKA67DRAFT_534104 [Truncatella angustata]|uniref:DUF1996 domain-containing protein n=1 Tax=Truncatella angustata TaxID=152316 RepID=A0A9P8UN64_9PEZI|nr:uncharacterized protein BKA67DRAFT_534104 [Truncatella angustata]KAH6655168.1 hypothetical protein BKA67DRAFT_534104 [Truncatella angustata]KAH8200452.1 hypothetical protein TruAng_005415 [Truncatella angustata]
MAPKLWTSLVVLNALNGASAFWRMECRGRVALARIDPIMSLGSTAEHAHTIHGSSAFSESADTDELLAGNCTSCAVTQDLSAYWTPALYFEFSNGTFELVQQDGGMLAYYLLRDPNDNVKAFPEGFRMIAGDNLRRNYTVGDVSQPDPPQSNWAALGQTGQSDLEQRALGFNCLDYSKTAEAALYRHFMPEKSYLDANCPDGLRFELAFPSCWNGKDLDSDNHKSHMAYPDLVQDGNCPDGFETRLVTLFYETIWATYKYDGIDGQFVIANGDPTGFGYHGDFMMGWEEDFLQSAVDQCTNLSGLIEDCELFTIQSEEDQTQCHIETMPSILKVENVLGGAADVLTSLPGNLAIQYGPERATIGSGSGASSSASLTTTYSAPALTYAPASSSTLGALFYEASSASSASAASSAGKATIQDIPKASTSSATAPATTSAPTSASGVQYETVSTGYFTNGRVVSEIVYEEAVVYVTEDVVTTVTINPTATAKAESKRSQRDHLLRHRHVHAGHH